MATESTKARGSPSTTPVRSSLLTFLIADIRGYTRFTMEQGDEAAARLASRFAEICENVIGAREGDLIELRGDEALAAFSSARDALRTAVALQDAFRDATEGDSSVPLQVGIGLDAGDAIPVKGGYRGGALNLAARLCSVAGAGEVLCSETVVGLARKMDTIVVVDRGQAIFKGLTDAVRVFQIAQEGTVPTDLPPLQQMLVAHPNNLPDEPTPFIGREREIGEIANLLQQPRVRLVTLTGPGGTGKTRLALQVGATLLYDFNDGVYFVSLAATGDPSLVPSAIATTLGVKERAGQSLEETLADFLRAKHLLLILDNFEHLLSACTLVVTLLERCPTLSVVVTSQTVLHLSREHVVEVPPLTVPDPRNLPELGMLTEYEAVALFLSRAQAAKSGFSITDETGPAIAEICYRLDGLPLAIELAAARIRLFPPQALLARLSDRLKLLTGGARDLPTRHQTLRGTIDWSYSTLTEAEQKLFGRLSVFAGGCRLDAVHAVCSVEVSPQIDVLDGMASLVDKSLLQQAGDDEPRFLMLETLREYAAERLDNCGEADEIHRRHASHFIVVAEEAEAEMLGGVRLREWLDRLEAEHDNLREAIGWLLRAGPAADALRLAGALFPFWNARGHWREGRRWLEKALSAGVAPDAVKAKALAGVGNIAGPRHGDFEHAKVRLAEALMLWRGLGDASRTGHALTGLANIAYQQGDECWREFRDEALARLPEVQSASWQAAILVNLGPVVYIAGDSDRAQRLFEEALVLSREAGHELYTASALGWLARLALDRGDLPRAKALTREDLDVARRGQYMLAVLISLEMFAEVAATEGQAERAGHLYGAVDVLQQTTGGWLLPQILAKRAPLIFAARAQIGEEAWTTASQEGRAMSLEEAVTYALGETG